jgi:branched-subunit amino acid ABC-type transport system permease component
MSDCSVTGGHLSDTLLFALEATLNGLTAGVMYALVALGFVLIFKASGIFNFAQGVMALFAALTLVGFPERANSILAPASMRSAARAASLSAGTCPRFAGHSRHHAGDDRCWPS